jgi:hypothetical protein
VADPPGAIAAYRGLITQHPEFAECHYRLARLLAQKEAWDEARQEFILARDLDGAPARCPTDLREVIRTVARERDALLIDGPILLAALSQHGILDDQLYHDAHHVNLIGTIALAEEILRQLKARRAFGWPDATPVPRIELGECAQHFELDAKKWAEVCRRSAGWYQNTAFLRYDPSERLAISARYREAGHAIAEGRPLPATIPGNLVPFIPIIKGVRGSTEEGSHGVRTSGGR